MLDFCFDRDQIISRDDLRNLPPFAIVTRPLAKIDMKTKAESRISPTLLNRFGRGAAVNHQARARYNSMLVRVKDAAINLGAETKVVRIHDQRSICCHTTYLVPSTKRLSRSRLSTSTMSGQRLWVCLNAQWATPEKPALSSSSSM